MGTNHKQILITSLTFVFFFLISVNSSIAIIKPESDSLKYLSFGELKKKYQDSLPENPQQSLAYARQMMQLAQNNKISGQYYASHIDCAQAFYKLNMYNSVLYFLKRSKDFYKNKNTQNQSLLAKSFHLKSDVFYYLGKHDSGLLFIDKTIQIHQKLDDSAGIARAKRDKAVLYREMGNYDEMFDLLIDVLSYFEKNRDSLNLADTYRLLASVYGSMNEMDKFDQNLAIAKNYLTNFKESNLYEIVLDMIASGYKMKNQADSAIIIYDQLIELAKRKQDTRKLGNLFVNKGNSLMKLNRVDSALQSFRKAREHYTELGLEKYICHAEYSIGELYYAIYNYDSAEYYLMKSMKTSDRINYAPIYGASLNVLFKLFKEKENYKKALNYYQKHQYYIDSVKGERIKMHIAELETKYQTARKEKLIKELELQQEIEKSEKRTQRIVFASIFLVLMIFIWFLWQKRKRDQQLHKQKEKQLETEQNLARSELEKSRIKEKELQQSLQYKSKQLSTQALHMVQKNSLLQEIQENIRKLAKSTSSDDKMEYKRLRFLINQSLKSDKEWEVFKLYFEEINKNFYNTIENVNPELTKNDLRLCALIKLNMSSKEIASVLNLAPNSIKSSRYRLKKKLGLEVEDDLESFLRAIK